MSLFARLTDTISTFWAPRKPRNVIRRNTASKRNSLQLLSRNVDSDIVSTQPKNKRKRKLSLEATEDTKKKLKLGARDEHVVLEGSVPFPWSPEVSQANDDLVASSKARTGQALTPPPSCKNGKRTSTNASKFQVECPILSNLDGQENRSPDYENLDRHTRAAFNPADSASTSTRLERHYQAAITLPTESGVWAEAEQDLFFRLALRGFEPLLPASWMLDFPTYPLALYSTKDNPSPLIQSMSGNDFRATKALKELNEMGKRLRDRALTADSSPGIVRPEPIISSTISSYNEWALTDANLHSPQDSAVLPVHVIVTAERGQSTLEAIKAMTSQLHDLASQHRNRRGIHQSVEYDTAHASGEILEDNNNELPILTGIMICSSLVNIVTLNTQSASPSMDDEAGLKLIATFDFSDSRMDVWNALAIAIVAMHIRKMMLVQNPLAQDHAGEPEVQGNGQSGEEEDAEDDPDV